MKELPITDIYQPKLNAIHGTAIVAIAIRNFWLGDKYYRVTWKFYTEHTICLIHKNRERIGVGYATKHPKDSLNHVEAMKASFGRATRKFSVSMHKVFWTWFKLMFLT